MPIFDPAAHEVRGAAAAAAAVDALRLPEHWRGRGRFTLLLTHFGDGRLFEAVRDAWRADAGRCGRLHVVALEPSATAARGVRTAPPHALSGSPGVELDGPHRLETDGGAIVLTLLRGGDPKRALQAMRTSFDGLVAADPADVERMPVLARRLLPDAPVLIATPADARLSAALARSGFVRPMAVPTMPGWTLAVHAPAWSRTRRWLETDAPGQPASRTDRRAVVVGAGLAGTAVAAALADRGWRVVIVDQAPTVAAGASGNLVGAFHPHLSLDDCALSRLSRAGVAALLRELQRLDAFGAGLAARCGALQLGSDDDASRALQRAAAQLGVPGYAAAVDARQASALAGIELARGGVHLAQAGWVRPAALCARRLSAHAGVAAASAHGGGDVGSIEPMLGVPAARLVRCDDTWRLLDDAGRLLAQAPVVVVACAGRAGPLLASAGAGASGLLDVTGQLTHLPADGAPRVGCVVTAAGYLLPVVEDTVVAGAEYGESRPDAHARNLARVAAMLRPGSSAERAVNALRASPLGGRAASRCATPDRLPVIGAAVDARAASGSTAPRWAMPRMPGLHVVTGLGSRGILWSALAGEVLAARLEDEPDPLDGRLMASIDPARLAGAG